MSFSSGAYFGSHSRVSQFRWASAQVVSLLRWIGPLSRTATSGRARSAVPYAEPSWSSRATKSVERLVALVWKGVGAPDQRRRAWPVFSHGRGLGCATRHRAGPSNAPDRDA